MEDRELLERIDRHLERSNAHMERGNEHMERGNEHRKRGNELMDEIREEMRLSREQAARHAELYSGLLDFMREITREMTVRMERFTREMTTRMDRCLRDQTAELRGLRSETRDLGGGIRDLREESRAQTRALLQVLDRLESSGPSASTG